MKDLLQEWIETYIISSLEYEKTTESSYSIIGPLDVKELAEFLFNQMNQMEGTE